MGMDVQDSGHAVPALAQGVTQKVTISGTSAQSAAFGGNTRAIRIVADTDIWYLIALDPTAATAGTNSSFLPANVVEVKKVTPETKIAGIQDSASGFLSIEEQK